MKRTFFFAALFIVLLFLFFFVGKTSPAKEITWGVNFSEKQAERLGLDWKETYLALLEDLGAKNLKIAAHWDLLEPRDQQFFFEDLDWQMDRAKEHGAKVLLAIGMKTPRWPECHIPSFAETFSKEELRAQILEMLSQVVARYKDHPALEAWQVENEPLLAFGKCPWRDFSFLQKEMELVQSLDSGHDVFTSDSGELSLWWNASRLGDKVAVTLYQKIWSGELNTYLSLPFPAVSYQRKAWLVEKLFGKKVIVGELQAEPWVKGELEHSTIAEQEKTMPISQVQDNISFARQTGLGTFYLWGAEWWYWRKTKYEDASFWEEARNVFSHDEKL
ncbi:MAG: beta-galactosidase [bacterium]|nr:beta-galactosidase [bacterium]